MLVVMLLGMRGLLLLRPVEASTAWVPLEERLVVVVAAATAPESML